MAIHFVITKEIGGGNYPFSKVCHDLIKDLQPSITLSTDYVDARYNDDDFVERHLHYIISKTSHSENKYVFVSCSSFLGVNTIRFLIGQELDNHSLKKITCQTMCVKRPSDNVENVYDHVVCIGLYNNTYSTKFHMAEGMLEEFKKVACLANKETEE